MRDERTHIKIHTDTRLFETDPYGGLVGTVAVDLTAVSDPDFAELVTRFVEHTLQNLLALVMAVTGSQLTTYGALRPLVGAYTLEVVSAHASLTIELPPRREELLVRLYAHALVRHEH